MTFFDQTRSVGASRQTHYIKPKTLSKMQEWRCMHAEIQQKYGPLDEIGTLSQPRGGLLHKKYWEKIWPRLKSAPRPLPRRKVLISAPFTGNRRTLVPRPQQQKRAEFSPNPPSLSAPCNKKKAESSQNPPLRWVVGGGMPPPPFCLNLILSSNRSKYGKI